ncbi:hypothetical protein JXR93_13355 [bacterium]|nr:hypothetical protein [bacterium]
MKKIIIILALLFSFSIFAERGYANGEEVKLGTAVGYSNVDESSELIWGFYVDIPIISTFHITPSALVYKIGDLSATDISLAFKFKIPLHLLTLYVDFLGGLTQAQFTPEDGLSTHVGIGGGGYFNFVSNISVFGEVNYKTIIRDDGNIKNYTAMAGLLWSF